jgi:predicted exporter
MQQQGKTYEAMKALVPLASSQYEYLGFPPEYGEIFYHEFAAGAEYCLPENVPVQAGISNLWIGENKENYFSCVLPLKSGDREIFRDIAGEFDSVYFIDKVNDISRDLDTLTRTIMMLFLAAYIAVAVMIFMVYPRQDSLKICGVPVFLCISALALLALNKIPIGFFSIAALVLVFGLGLDYILYMTGGKHKGNSGFTSLAVLLSFLTTLLSFGALGFSSFVPVHIFGLTVSGGLSAAFISSMLLQGKSGLVD